MKVKITLLDHSNAFQKINAIKAVRLLSGYGLKEAKEFVDDLMARGHGVIPDAPASPTGKLPVPVQREFKELGMLLESGSISLTKRLEQLLVASIREHDFVMAEGLLKLLRELS
jgi:hypothetical protein